MKAVNNPLTIVSIFCTLAEIAAISVLPSLSESLQSVFIWYVMGFPILLVILFFLTWNFNSKVLYSPSDFADNKLFLEYVKLLYTAKTATDIVDNTDSKALSDLQNVVIHQIDNLNELSTYISGSNADIVIKTLINAGKALSTMEIAEYAGISRATTHRYIKQLIENGYLSEIESQDENPNHRMIKKYTVKNGGRII